MLFRILIKYRIKNDIFKTRKTSKAKKEILAAHHVRIFRFGEK